MRLLVTGGSGLVGNAIQKVIKADHGNLFEECLFLSSADCDLRDAENTKNIFEKFRPSHVIHLAAKVGGLFANQADQLGFLRENLSINDNVVQNCEKNSVKRGIFCLSTCIFSPLSAMPLTEEQVHEGPPHWSNEGYALSKRILEASCRFSNKEKGSQFICVIPTNLYGEHDNFFPDRSHVVPALISRAYKRREEDKWEHLDVMGSGKAVRQFLHAEDCARIILKLLLKDNLKYDKYILTADEEIPIGDVARLVAQFSNLKNGVVFDPSKSDGVAKKTASNQRIKEEFGAENLSFIPLDVGIKRAVEWYDQQASDLRSGKAQVIHGIPQITF